MRILLLIENGNHYKNNDGNAAGRYLIKPQVLNMMKQKQNASQLDLFLCVWIPYILRIERGFVFYIFICPADCFYTKFKTHILLHERNTKVSDEGMFRRSAQVPPD